MGENKAEVAVGGLVLATALGFGFYVLQSTGMSGPSGSYPLTASFRSAEGISVGTDIRLAGVKVGTISQMALNPETFRADATLSVQDSIQIPDDSAIAITSEGLLGGNFVEVIPGASYDYLAAGDEIIDTQGSVSLISLLMKFVSGSGE
jgi:phospholipid/cholesterol/gamma-HCH transport system substrate-binding protein